MTGGDLDGGPHAMACDPLAALAASHRDHNPGARNRIPLTLRRNCAHVASDAEASNRSMT